MKKALRILAIVVVAPLILFLLAVALLEATAHTLTTFVLTGEWKWRRP